MLRMLLVIACAVRLSAQDPAKLEAVLKIDPGNREARGALLEYYFLNPRVDKATAIAARRRHILWLIENAPWDELAGAPAAAIDASGNRLADPKGFELASAAWWTQAIKPDARAATLVNAASFYKLADKESSVELLEKALVLEPKSKEIAVRLGDEYALAILCVTGIDRDGLPTSADPESYDGDVARRAREALNHAINPLLLAKAAYQLALQGAALTALHKIEFDPQPLAEATVARAISLAPKDADVGAYARKLKLATKSSVRDLL